MNSLPLKMSSIIILTPKNAEPDIGKDFCYHINPIYISSFVRVKKSDCEYTVVKTTNGDRFEVKELPIAIDAYIMYNKATQTSNDSEPLIPKDSAR